MTPVRHDGQNRRKGLRGRRPGARAGARLTAASLLLGLAIFSVAVLPTSVAGANTDTVTNCNDSGPGSLRDAVTNAAANDVIAFGATLSPCTAGTITLTSGQIDIEVPLTITGPGSGVLAVSGGGDSRVFQVDATSSISGLTIEDGDAGDGTSVSDSGDGTGDGGDGGAGGGILATAGLTLTDCVVTGNSAGNGGSAIDDNGGDGGDGGGVYDTEGLTLTGSTLSDNRAGGGGSTEAGSGGAGGAGGGVGGPGLTILTDSTVSGNAAGAGGASFIGSSGGGGAGGGVSTVALIVTDSSIDDNGAGPGGGGQDDGTAGAGGAGGGLSVGGSGTITDSVISANTAGGGGNELASGNGGAGGAGGGIATSSSLNISGSTVAGNSAGSGGSNTGADGGDGGDGGGLFNAGYLMVNDSTVSGNSSGGGGGSSFADGGNGGSGGAVFNDEGLFVATSTIADNDTGSGGGSIFGNGGNGGSGGGIDNELGLTITSSTVALNSAGSGGGSELGVDGNYGGGGGIDSDGEWSPGGTIVAENPQGGDCDATGTLNDLSFNLDDDGSCRFTGPGDLSDTAAGLDPAGLQSNGGPTQTIALVPGSAAIAADADYCGPDQRGVVRPQPCAIGAYEPVITLAPTALPPATAEAFYDEPLTAGGETGPYLFSVPPGTLPAGLVLASDGELSGIPTVAGPSFTFEVTAAASDGITGIRIYTLSIAAPTIGVVPTALTITAETPYDTDLQGTGGVTPYTFAVTGGAPPTGLKLESDGELHGTTATAGPYSFTVTATDGDGFTGTETYSGSVAAPTIVVKPPVVSNPTWGTAYTVTLSATGGASPYGFTEAGALPTGLTLNPSTGVLSGTPTDKTQIGHLFTFAVTATDAGQFAGTQGYSFTLGSPCGAGLTPYLLSATSRTGNFTGLFCVNAAGSGTYTQGTAHGTGTLTSSSGVTRVTAFGTDLSLIGQKTTTTSTFTETAPAPAKAGTFTLM